MSQSTFIVGALIAGFVLYLAAKGRLAVYTGVLWGNTAAAPPSSGSASSGSSSGSGLTSAVSSAIDVASLVAI